MPKNKEIRFSFVEYQPNLKNPTDPVPLGVVVEQVGEDGSLIFIMGRVPVGDPPELHLEDTWGPFREVAEGWYEAVYKSIRQSIDEVEYGESLLSHVAQLWRWNLYFTEPDVEKVRANTNTQDWALQKFEEYTGVDLESPQTEPEPIPSMGRRQPPWMKSESVLG